MILGVRYNTGSTVWYWIYGTILSLRYDTGSTVWYWVYAKILGLRYDTGSTLKYLVYSMILGLRYNTGSTLKYLVYGMILGLLYNTASTVQYWTCGTISATKRRYETFHRKGRQRSLSGGWGLEFTILLIYQSTNTNCNWEWPETRPRMTLYYKQGNIYLPIYGSSTLFLDLGRFSSFFIF
jgi:hypothetical protein